MENYINIKIFKNSRLLHDRNTLEILHLLMVKLLKVNKKRVIKFFAKAILISNLLIKKNFKSYRKKSLLIVFAIVLHLCL